MNNEIEWAVAIGVLLTAGITRLVLVNKFKVHEGFVGLLYHAGEFVRTLDPGTHKTFGFDYTMNLIDGRKTQLTVPGQDVLTADKVTIKVSVLLSYRITDADKVTHEVRSYWGEIYGVVQVALREAVGGAKADEVLDNRADIGGQLRASVPPQLAKIGIETITLDVKDVMPPSDLRRAFTDVIKARNEGLATLERARAESAAMRNLANAARLLDNNPSLLKLRTLRAYENGSGDQLTIVGSPLEMLKGDT